MEVSSGCCVLGVAAILVIFVWIVPYWLWFESTKKDKRLRDQSLDDNSYKCIFGDTKEMVQMTSEAKSKSISLTPRVPPFFYRSIATHEFQVGDKVMLKASSWKGIVRFENDGKFSPRFLGPFTVLEHVGSQAYKLDLPSEMHGIHDIFHVGYLYKCVAEKQNVIPLSTNVNTDDMTTRYTEEPELILDTKIKRLRNKQIILVKVQWRHRRGINVTWESKEDMQKRYPRLFT